MRVFNKTDWDTSQLRKLCNAVIRKVGSHKKHSIYIEYKKRRYSQYHGRASVNGSWITMFVPRLTMKTEVLTMSDNLVFGSDGNAMTEIKPVQFDCKSFAQVLEHEIGHNLGLLHDTMIPVHKIDAKYALQYPVSAKAVKEKPKIDIKQQRAENAKQKLAVYQSKLNRIAKLVRKYEKKVKYYEVEQWN